MAVLIIELDYFTPAAESPAELNRHLMYRIEASREKCVAGQDRHCGANRRNGRLRCWWIRSPMRITCCCSQEMQGAIALPITLDHHEVFLTGRIGLALSKRTI